MTNSKSVAVDTESSRELAELFGIRQDLSQATELCDQVLKLYEDLAAAEFSVFEALFTTAALKYARCFSSGVRPRLTDIIVPRFSSEQAEVHKFFLDYRDKFLAHSVNPYEQNYVTVTIPAESPEGWSPDRVNCHHVRHIVPGSQNVRNLRALAGWIDGLVAERMTAIEKEVLLALRAMSVSELSMLPLAKAASPSRNDVGYRR